MRLLLGENYELVTHRVKTRSILNIHKRLTDCLTRLPYEQASTFSYTLVSYAASVLLNCPLIWGISFDPASRR